MDTAGYSENSKGISHMPGVKQILGKNWPDGGTWSLVLLLTV